MRRLAPACAALLLALPGAAGAGAPVDAERDLQLLRQGVTPPKRFGNASFRVAVFSYEDPDGLGLGDALAALAGHEILAGALVQSIGMLRYVGRLTPKAGDPLGYFDKVELLARNQEPTVSLWGMVRREGEEVAIDTWLQIPEETVARGLQVRLALPRGMGPHELVARLGGDRLLLQRHRIPLAAVAQLRAAEARLEELRAEPREDASPVRLPALSAYYVEKRRGDWVRIVSGDKGGWAPIRGHCTGACAPLLDPPRFASALLRFLEKRVAPEAPATLAADAHLLADEIRAVQAFDRLPPEESRALEILRPWLPGAETPGGAAAAGAAPANLRLVGRVKAALWSTQDRRRPGEPLPSDIVRRIAYEAAEAAVVDPRDLDLLHNLQVLYGAIGDGPRAALAGKLLEQATASSRLHPLRDPAVDPRPAP